MPVANNIKETGNLLGWIIFIVVCFGGGMWLIVAAGGTVAGTATFVRELWVLGWSFIADLLKGVDAPQ